MMSEKTLVRPTRSLTMESVSPDDLPRQGEAAVLSDAHSPPDSNLAALPSVEFLEAMRQQVQKFEVQYIGNLPVSRAMGETSPV